MPPPTTEFDPIGICRVLADEEVQFVVVGGFAAVAHGSSIPTHDIDIVPERSAANLDRLARALTRLNARIRTGGEAVAAPLDAAFLAAMPLMLNLTTDLGDLDLTFDPTGDLDGYAGWRVGARETVVADHLVVWIAALDDVIASKVAANRTKDQLQLPYLESLRDQIALTAGRAEPDD